MQKEKLMQYLSEAIDKGLRISVASFSSNVNKEVAVEFAARLSDLAEAPVREIESEGSKWFSVKGSNLEGDFFFDTRVTGFMEEDVDLSGSAEIA
ncbi:hypothetical protein [Cytobacillus praedii]|uniref:hypothetical protein n=1 Tax=Cytobacillus praedii TaxID=1742358 RepID=UPI002E1D6F56|nr:hypothetical protein [Cytobacillus praedii]